MIGKQTYNENELLSQVARGNEQAFQQLIYQYSQRVFFHALTFVKSWHQAEEMVQDIFMRIWQKRDKLDQVDDWDKYLYTICRNFLINAMRRMDPNFEPGEMEGVEEHLRPDHQQENKELRVLLDKAIEQLPEQKKAVFTMIHLEGLTQEEVSRQLGIATRTVRWNLVSAINQIRDFLHRNAADTIYFILFTLLSFF